MNTRRVGALALCLCLATAVVAGAQSPSSAQSEPDAVEVRVSAPMTVERLMSLKVPRVCDFRGAVYVDGVHPESPRPLGTFAEVVGAGDSAGRSSAAVREASTAFTSAGGGSRMRTIETPGR